MKNGRYEIGDTFEYNYGHGSVYTTIATVIHVWGDGSVQIEFEGFNGLETKNL
jgi:hypothetical protein